jgi:hypothetical protein
MRFAPAAILTAANAALSATAPANAGALKVVEVNAPAVNCAFNSSCKVVVDDSIGTMQYTPLGGGAFLQSRTYPGEAGTPAAGMTAYEYRVDLTEATGYTECLAGLVIDFGPVQTLTYPTNQPGQVFVTTQGGTGSLGIQSAEQDGTVITFTFNGYLCAGQSSHFFWSGVGHGAASGDRDAVRLRQSAVRSDHRPHAAALKKSSNCHFGGVSMHHQINLRRTS